MIAPDTDRVIGVLMQALAVCRGMLYSARTGGASHGEIERILESTGEDTLRSLIGTEALSEAVRLWEALPPDDRDTLLAIRDERD